MRPGNEGKFTLKNLPETPLKLLAEHPEFQSGTSTEGIHASFGSQPSGALLRLERGDTTHFQTLDSASGASVGNAKVNVLIPRQDEEPWYNRKAFTDREGKVTLSGLRVGAAKVQLFAPGYADYADENFNVLRDRRDPVRIVPEREAGLAGQVLDEDGHGLE